MQKRKALTILLLAVFSATQAATPEGKKLHNLCVEYTPTPIGTDAERPRFSWEMGSTPGKRGEKQSAYQIVVRDETEKEMWNTGKVESDLSLHIRYSGQPLAPTTRYTWELSVWDEEKKKTTASSWFETGLMDGDSTYRNWDGARWIGYPPGEEKNFYTPYLPVFRLHFAIQLDEKSKSTRASIVYGANDGRLMDANKNIYHLANPKDSSFIAIELDTSPLDSGGKEALLHIYRAGYHPQDRRDTPLKSIPIPGNILNRGNRYSKHSFSLSTELGTTRLYAGREEQEIGQAGLNPLGQGGDFIAFPVAGEVGFALRPGQKATFSDVWLANYRSPAGKLRDIQEKPLALSGESTGLFRVFPLEGKAAPMLRTVFTTAPGKEIKRARLYITARGIYELRMNGKRVSSDYFNPGLTQYNKNHLYQTYDITPYIQAGENALGVQLSEGWWSGAATFTGDNWNFFGDCQSLLAKLVVTYADGSEQCVVSNPETWQSYDKSPVAYGSFFQGEVYDARREATLAGWDTPGYPASSAGWVPASEIPLEGHVSLDGNPDKPKVDDFSQLSLTGQYGPTVQAIDTLTARSVSEPRPGVFVYDMGQNIAGVPEITLPPMLEPGQRITLRYAEILYPPLPGYEADCGMPMLENIRAAMAQDIYIARGGEEAETIAPRFTFHGYRYIEITGLHKPLPLESVKSIALSSLHEVVSGYTTSDERVNRLWENIIWSSRANFLSIPTDCPQRNERLGWAGDISVFARTGTYLADISQFLRRYLQSMRDVQREDGRFPDIAPLGGGFGGLLWGSAGITVPWECFQQYGDTVLLEEHYGAMARYIDFILDNEIDPSTNLIVQNRAWGDLCDWLGPEDGKNDKPLVWEAYFIYDLDLMAKMAAVLGKEEDAARFGRLRDERKDFFYRTFIQPGTGKTIHSAFNQELQGKPVDTQTSYALPLAFGIIGKGKREFVENFVETVTRENHTDQGRACPPYSLMTGFIGTAWISEALSRTGHTDIAYRLLLQTSYPSWLYSVEQGATTIWERLDSYTHTDGFGGNNRMNSFNHYSFGAVGAWMYSRSLGIQRDEGSPGFKHFFLKPEADPTAQITHAEGFYHSPYGTIGSSWRILEEGRVEYRFRVPANTTATLYLPARALEDITEGGRPVAESAGVEPAGTTTNGLQALEILSGEYCFVVERAAH